MIERGRAATQVPGEIAKEPLLKRLRKVIAGIAVFLVLLIVLVMFLPAAWVRPYVEARLRGTRLLDVSGSVWHGHAAHLVLPNGRDLGGLDWQLSRWTLFGKLALGFHVAGPDLDLTAQVESQDGNRQHWHDVQLRLDAALLAGTTTPWGMPQGELVATVKDAVLRASWPESLDAHGQWRDAALVAAQGPIALGGLDWRASAVDAVLQVHVGDAPGGPLQVDGEAAVSLVGWRYRFDARPRGTQPALHAWLATLGALGPDGTLHREGRGGLAALAN